MAIPVTYTHVIIGNAVYSCPLEIVPSRQIREFEPLLTKLREDYKPDQPPLHLSPTPIVCLEGEEYRLVQPTACYADRMATHSPSSVVCGVLPSNLSTEECAAVTKYLRELPSGPIVAQATKSGRSLAFDPPVIQQLAKWFQMDIGPRFYRTLVGPALTEKTSERISTEAQVRWAWNPIAEDHNLAEYDALLHVVPKGLHDKFRQWLLEKIEQKTNPKCVWTAIEKRFLSGGAK